jgi:homoserine O-acetyltransferase/O-succinyltransferase
MFLLLATALLTGLIGDFKLQSGQVLKDCQVTYRTYGKRNADSSNIVLFPTWFNGASEDAETYIKPGGLVDPSKFHVIVVDALGNGNATSPSNYKFATPQRFPRITINDMVQSQHLLLTRVLKIDKVHAIVGVSMGAMQAFQWLVQYPEFASRAVPIVGTPRMSERDVLLWSTYFKLGRGGAPTEATPTDAAQNTSSGQGSAGSPNTGEPQPKKSILATILGMAGQAPTMYKKYRQPFNAMRQFEAIVAHDISKLAERSMERAGAAIRARMLVVVATQDKAVSPATAIEFAKATRSELLELTGSCGHAAYKCELEALSPVIARFLETPSPSPDSSPGNRTRSLAKP